MTFAASLRGKIRSGSIPQLSCRRYSVYDAIVFLFALARINRRAIDRPRIYSIFNGK